MNHFGDTPHLKRQDIVGTRTWDRLVADLRDRLARLREENDHGDAETTARRRGRIAEIKELLAFGEDVKAQPVEDVR